MDYFSTSKSFVKKVTSRVSGFLPSSLSKWFANTDSAAVRPRDDSDDDDDESLRIQPPAKKVKANESTPPALSTPISLHSNNNHHARHLFFAPRAEIGDRTKHNASANCIKFPEPVAGPSGYCSSKTSSTAATKSSLNVNVITSTAKKGASRNCDSISDSGESTSGYSSRVGSKERIIAENSEQVKRKRSDVSSDISVIDTPSKKQDRSLFKDDLTLSPNTNTSLSTRQPSFNSTAFGTANFVDRTLSSKRILNSPFYSGRTTYGGASAYGRRMAERAHDTSAINRNSIQIKPINETRSENASLSRTAKRILVTLEHFAVPTTDARKIPNPPRNSARYTHANPYAIRETKVPSNKELQVPTVPDLLQMKQKEKMQNTTVSVRRIANSSKCPLNTEEYKIATLEEDNHASKRSNKIKTKISSVREPKTELNETVKEVKLPDVKLPITTLPVFDFAIPAPPAASSISKPIETISSTTKTVKTTEKITVGHNEKSIEVKKSEEIVKETIKKDNNRTEQNASKTDKTECIKQTEYIFSDPTVLSESSANTWECKVCLVRNKIGDTKCNACSSLNTINGTTNHKKYTYTFADPLSIEEKSQSTIKNDLSQFKMSANKWECSTCLVWNNSTDTKCVACTTPKVTNGSIIPPVKSAPKFTFGQFQPSDTWECSVCMIRNKNDRKTCEACTSPKPAPKHENGILEKNDKPTDKLKSDTPKYPGLSLFNKSYTPPKLQEKQSIKTDSNLMDKFKPDSNTWECSTCMVRNKNTVTSCVACTTPRKQNGFGDQFKKKDDQWECGSCMVRNPSDKLKCVCCDTPKPGSNHQMNVPKETKSIASFNFGIVNNEVVGQMFNFGAKKQVENTPDKSTGSIFGQQAVETKTSTPPKFVFGVNTETKKDESTTKVDNEDKNTDNKPVEVTNPPLKQTLNGDMGKTPLLFGNIPKPTETKPTFSFGTTPKSETTETKQNPLPQVSQPFTFGTSTPSTSLFTAPTTTSTAPAINPPTNTSLAVFTFGNAEKPTFGGQSEKPKFGVGSSTDKPAFGQPNNPIFGQPTEKPIFGQPEKSTFGQPTEKPTFAPPAEKPTLGQPVEKPMFGQPTEKSIFGAPQPTEKTFGVPQLTDKPTFGVQPATNPTFGLPATDKPTFGVPSDKPTFAPPAEQPTFGVPAVQSPGFFGNSTTMAPGANKFGSSPAPTPAPGGFSFGTPVNATPAAQNGTFTFGSANKTPKPSINFGGQQSASPGVFNFGSTPSTSTAPSSSGFNFSANTDIQPNFNFTAGAPPTSFNAPTSGSSVSERRVIRRALRRTQR